MREALQHYGSGVRRPRSWASCLARAVVGILLWEAARRAGRGIELRPHSVEVRAPRERVAARLREKLGAGDVLLEAGDALVARFSGTAGAFSYATVEVVSFTQDEIRFEHLGGTFAACTERFLLGELEGRTRIVHVGEFRLRGGLVAWLLAGRAVRSGFEAHVAQHLDLLAAELEADGLTP